VPPARPDPVPALSAATSPGTVYCCSISSTSSTMPCQTHSYPVVSCRSAPPHPPALGCSLPLLLLLLTCPRAALLNCFILASFSHVLKRSISRSMDFRASSSALLSFMSAPEILQGTQQQQQQQQQQETSQTSTSNSTALRQQHSMAHSNRSWC